jgi:hypothetical protein
MVAFAFVKWNTTGLPIFSSSIKSHYNSSNFNLTKWLFESKGIHKSPRMDRGTISQFNTDKGMLRLKKECLYWSNGGYSPVSIWWLMLRYIVWSSMKSSILSEGGEVGSWVDRRKLSGFNTDKGMLGLKNQCLYWSNGDYSPASIWGLMLRYIVWSSMKSSILSEGGEV